MKSYRYYRNSKKISTKNLSLLIGVHRTTIFNWTVKGMPVHGEGKSRYFILDEVLNWMKEQPKLMELYIMVKIKMDFD